MEARFCIPQTLMNCIPRTAIILLSFASLRTFAAPFAWGFNDRGQVGDGSLVNRALPVAVTTSGGLAGKSVTAIAAGGYHTLALTSTNELYAWGYNQFGQLGDASFTSRTEPVAVTMTGALAGKTVTAIAAGTHHCLVLTSDGKVFGWGYNENGAVGNGSTNNRNTPVAVSTSGVLAGKSVVAIATGLQQCLALTSDHQLFSWGMNNFGQLGDGSNSTRTLPVAVIVSGNLAGQTVTGIAAGRDHSLALTSGGKLFAWGYNNFGQLGDGTNTNRNTPVAVNMTGALAGKFVSAMDGGYSHSVALTSGGEGFAWGRNDDGNLGDGTVTNRNVPVAVTAGALPAGIPLVSIAAGRSHSTALTLDGRVFAWGLNDNGQMGDGTNTMRVSPVPVTTSGVLAGKTVAAISTGYDQNIVLAVTAIENWRRTHFGGELSAGPAADNADPDKDGLENLAEFAFALNPNAPDAAALPAWQLSDDDYFLTFTRPPNVSGITYIAEQSTTLAPGSWTAIPNASTPPQYTYYVTAAAGMRRYLRLRVSAP
jgi:alpha-tubulin suppressor-like RCC1 family protein